MTRAVIELSGDVLSALPELSRRIEGSYYHPTIPSLAFRFEDLWVIVEKDKINVYNIVDEAKILGPVDYLPGDSFPGPIHKIQG